MERDKDKGQMCQLTTQIVVPWMCERSRPFGLVVVCDFIGMFYDKGCSGRVYLSFFNNKKSTCLLGIRFFMEEVFVVP
jgi:hypothetical protein